MMEEILKEFVQHGFSVAVAAFLLLRVEKELRLLRGAIETLRHCPTCTVSPWRTPEIIEGDNEV